MGNREFFLFEEFSYSFISTVTDAFITTLVVLVLFRYTEGKPIAL